MEGCYLIMSFILERLLRDKVIDETICVKTKQCLVAIILDDAE